MTDPTDYLFEDQGLCTVTLVKPRIAMLESYLEGKAYKLREYASRTSNTLVPHIKTFNFNRWLATINQDEDDETLAKIKQIMAGKSTVVGVSRECRHQLGLFVSSRGRWKVGDKLVTWSLLDDDYLVYNLRDVDMSEAMGILGCACLTEADWFNEPALQLNTHSDMYTPSQRSEFLYGRHVGASYFCYINECNVSEKPPILEANGSPWDGSEIDPVMLIFWDDMTEDYSATLNLSNGIH